MKKKDIQFNLRIPEDLKLKIDEAAKVNQRSINAETMSRLYDSFVMDNNIHLEAAKVIENFLQARTPTQRKKDVAERLNFLFNEIKKSLHFKDLTVAELAYKIGESSADSAESWFRAEMEPTFNQLEQIANFLSANSNWLLFGKERPFKVESFRFDENIDKDIRWLLTPNPEKEFLKNQSVKEVKFIRCLNAEGSLIVAKLYSNQYLECFHTPYHISDITGVGGYNSLLYLCLLFKTLKKYHSSYHHPNIYSFLISEEMAKKIWAEETHPLPLIDQLRHIPWMDDLADALPNRSLDEFYWQGFDVLRSRLIKDFNEKEFIKHHWNDSEFHIKHPMNFD
ncbi:TPA: Arc family DNA-binding protein [Acinetobacter baumannii]|uniref:Arc-like DNA binding domain-containing protein n=4 Tax=Acinetobacter TaxID=469 RepID=A0ABX6CFJ0_ACIB2|nr:MULTISPECIES: Arc family DNA-binding protein [Acinetobacter]ARN31050.1 hypothetical protein A4U85_10020 [Acinetobacter baumannii]EME58872.1 helix-turn-helix domain-containing protein [Acinetobacter baumannii MSP4-16]ENW75328.1 hypothetical protein F911_02246 [Acinetobacter baumannii ATCC 19606 = CIP 70.34 = JCM 6841]KFC01766.1 arc-like DNA binding domain protein [Acinetobacter baumannii ATCC 19606 = CIP 70.34 = JCM 6841]MBA8657233.1 Arc family DNA-binding protein [Acinetobacter baumannii]